MPHIVFHFYPGRTEEKKKEIARKLKECAVQELGFPEETVSVAIVETEADQFKEQIHEMYDAEDIYIDSRYIN